MLSVQWAGLAEIGEAEIAAWQDLHRRAAEPNVFYTPAFVVAGMRHLPDGQHTRLLMVWRRAEAGRRLAGLLPLVDDRTRYLVPQRLMRAAEFYGPLSTPLMDAESPKATWTAMLDALAADGARALLLGHATAAGPLHAALRAACADSGRKAGIIAGHERALLASELPGDAYVRATLETKRRKEADRQRRRLAERGELDLRIARAPDEVMPALEAFLELEAAGWKGKRGTDLKHAPGAAPFIREVAGALAPEGAIRVVTLLSRGKPAAAGLVATSGTRAFYIKTAYDEELARYSPGLLLTLDITRHLLDDPSVNDADSIAVAGHPMIDHVWTARLPIEAAMVSCRPGADPAFRLIAGLERLREKVRLSTAKMRARF
jgi:CelD/BcsL family acetyltransferase involved in cellulose biosynthesis